MADCDCEKYPPLELDRQSISKRSKQTKALKARLEKVAEHADKEHTLYRCPRCKRMWQSSLAWNWGNKEYFFIVPETTREEWLTLPYVQPDELLIYSAVMTRFLEGQTWESTDRPCRHEGCSKNAVKLSVFCKVHHIEDLQRNRMLPAPIAGKWFEPYASAVGKTIS